MPTSSLSPVRARPVVNWVWAAGWATLFTGALFLTALISGDGCWFYLNPNSVVLAVATILWLWLFVFFSFKNRGRVVLIACTLLVCAVVYAGFPRVIRSDVAAAETSAVGTLRTCMKSLQSYKDSHPQEGYPHTLPDVQLSPDLQRFFTFTYFPFHSKPTGPADGFRVEAVPRQMRCGFQRSFTIFEDGTIHYTSDTRPAGKNDPPI